MSLAPYDTARDEPQPLTYQATESEQRDIDLVGSKFREAQQYRRILDEVWIECLAMEMGKQWHRYNWSAGCLQEVKAPSWVIKSAHNLIRPKVAQCAAALVGDMPQLDVDPQSNTQEDKEDARAGQNLLKYLQARLGWDSLLVGEGRWISMCGTSFVKVIWDPHEMDMHAVPQIDPLTGELAYEPVLDPETGQPAIDPMTGMPVQGKPIIRGEPAPIGQVKTCFVSPFEIYTPVGVQDWDEIEWCIHAKMRTLEYIKERYPEKGKYVQAETPNANTGGYIEKRVSDILQGGPSYQVSGQSPWASVLEFWRKPCPKYPRGQLLVVANGVLLRSSVLPYQHLIVRRELPFVPFIYEPFELRVWGKGMVEDLVPLQREYNNLWSRTFGSLIMMGWPKILKNETVQMSSQSNTSQPGEIVTYRGDPNMAPTYWTPPSPPPMVTELLDRIRGDMDDIAYRHAVSGGSHVPGLDAGVSIQLAQEADNQSFGPIRTLFHASIAEMGMHALSLCAQFYDEDRLGYVIGENEKPEIVAFNRAGLPDYANVKPSTTAATPMSRAARQQMLFDLYDRGIFGPPGSPVANKTILERLEFGNVSEMVEEQQAAAVEQQRQALEQQQAQSGMKMQESDQKHGQQMEMADRGEAAQLQRDNTRNDGAIALQMTRAAMQPAPSAPRVG